MSINNCVHSYVQVPDTSMVDYINCTVHLFRCVKCNVVKKIFHPVPKPETFSAEDLEKMYKQGRKWSGKFFQ